MTRHPLGMLTISRLREFFREPEAIFWVYGFPVLLAVGLGIAFRDKPPDLLRVDVRVDSPAAGASADETVRALAATKGFRATPCRGQECFDRLRLGRTDIV